MIFKKKKYSEIVKQRFLPEASERKRQELQQEIMNPKNKWGKALGHADPSLNDPRLIDVAPRNVKSSELLPDILSPRAQS